VARSACNVPNRFQSSALHLCSHSRILSWAISCKQLAMPDRSIESAVRTSGRTALFRDVRERLLCTGQRTDMLVTPLGIGALVLPLYRGFSLPAGTRLTKKASPGKRTKCSETSESLIGAIHESPLPYRVGTFAHGAPMSWHSTSNRCTQFRHWVNVRKRGIWVTLPNHLWT